jgi:hypothetical protein
MRTDIARRKEQFQIEIRKQGLNKILGLKRIKPKLVDSDSQAVTSLLIEAHHSSRWTTNHTKRFKRLGTC